MKNKNICHTVSAGLDRSSGIKNVDWAFIRSEMCFYRRVVFQLARAKKIARNLSRKLLIVTIFLPAEQRWQKLKIAQIKLTTTGEEIIVRPFGLPDIFLHSLTRTKDVNNSEHQKCITYRRHLFSSFRIFFIFSFFFFFTPFAHSPVRLSSQHKSHVHLSRPMKLLRKRREKFIHVSFSESIFLPYI